ncbi:MAG: hypothetical protein L0387_01315 [Acidobacteria bacterium]|nr:hypothetical protein [Acidobacteriota bacterium]
MDTDVLVENKIVDGESLIRQLIREQFGVEVAFWVKTSEAGLWQLWIASPAVDPRNLGEALRKVYAALTKIPDCSVSPSEIKLLIDTDPIAREALALRDRYPSRDLKTYHAQRLGKLAIEELRIYPRRFPLKTRELPDGTWQVLISERDDVWLMCDSEEDARAIAAAPVLEYEALARVKSGPQFAAELEKTADALAKYRMSFGSRFLRRRAQEVRETAEGPGRTSR